MSGRSERIAAYRAVQQRYRPNRREFGRLVQEALASLPEEFRRRLDNVLVVVEDWPPGGQSDPADETLLGLYRGTPYGERGTAYHLATPDRITIYRGPILARARTRDQVLREVRDTVVHEVGHYFGLGDEELP